MDAEAALPATSIATGTDAIADAGKRPRLTRYGSDPGSGCGPCALGNPGNALHQIARGHEQVLSRQFSEAEASFRAAIALAPTWPMPHNNLGWALQAQGRNEEAVACYKQALALDPELELAQANLAYLLATLYTFMGRREQARAMWLHILRLYPQDHEVLDQLISTALRLNTIADAGQWATRHAAATRGSLFHRLLEDAAYLPPEAPLPAPRLTRGKLLHDEKQFRYLREQGLLGPGFDDIITRYAEAAQAFRDNNTAQLETLEQTPALKNTYGRIVHHYPAPRLAGPALSASVQRQEAEKEYLASKLGIVVIDDFLFPQALAELQKFCLESTVWHSNHYSYERLGSFFREGFNCPLLLQVAEEIQAAFPTVIGTQHPLLQMWGYKYRHDQPATHPHADFAAVNVNFWITPDAANQSPESGGLVVYDVEAPLDWDFESYNRQGDKIAAFLNESGAKSIVIPYRCNRAIIFNSDLFHTTAPLNFLPGYENQRINITMLYGERG